MPADESVNPAAQEYYCRLTDAGAALEAAAHAEAKPVVLTHVAVGDGDGEVPAPAATATALVHEVYRRQIDGRERDKEDPNIAWLHIIIPADEGGFWIREFGVYAAPLPEGGEPVLYAYGNHAPYYKQQASQGQATTHELSIPIVMSGAAEVEISVRDAGYATELALDDLRRGLLENDGEGPKLLPAALPLATADKAGAVKPDGATTTVDEAGLLAALGGNLLLNTETVITESGEWEAPVTGWYFAFLVAGGDGGMTLQSSSNNYNAYGGAGGRRVLKLMYLEAGDVLQAIIGAGGIGYNRVLETTGAEKGGATSFGDYSTDDDGAWGYPTIVSTNTLPSTRATGNGPGGGESWTAGKYYGAGGGAGWLTNASAYNGAQGAVFLYYHDPALAAGPVPVPALFAARRVAADAPATVNLYDPETGQGSVWREEDAEAKLAEGLITEAAWQEICAARAAEEYAAWLADPDTGAERFAMLRQARDAKLAEHDVQVVQLQRQARAGADVADDLAAWDAYANALCALPAQEGAPWDGGGEATPWPDAPTVETAQEEA